MKKLKFWEKNFWQWPEMRFGRCWQVMGVTKLVTSTMGNRGRKNVVLRNEWYHETIPKPEKKKWKLEIWQSGKIAHDLWLVPDRSGMEIPQLKNGPQRRISTNGNWGRKKSVERWTRESLLMVGRLSGIDETLRLMRWGNFPELLIGAEKGIIN